MGLLDIFSRSANKDYEFSQSYDKPKKKKSKKQKIYKNDPFKKRTFGAAVLRKVFTTTEPVEDAVKISPHIYGRPVQEVDPFVFDDTFCVISKKFNKHYVFRFSSSYSFYVFSPLNIIRRFCVHIVTHQMFDICIILTILANCVALACDSNELKLCTKDNVNEGHEDYYKGCIGYVGKYIAEEITLPSAVEWLFLQIYTAELLLKVIAKGFVLNKYSYLRNGWNILDFIIVIFGYATEILTERNVDKEFDLDIFRTFRVLRAVKTISILPGLRMMINALMNSMVQLIEVMALTFFCLCIFSLFALEVFTGKFHQVCVLDKGSKTAREMYRMPGMEPITELTEYRDYKWRMWVNSRKNWIERDFPKEEYTPCGNDSGARSCPDDYTCLPGLNDNPDEGWTNFDHFFNSMLSTFQLVTLDFWERLYELVMSTAGAWCLPFFVMVVFLGSFYLLNLMLAVVTMSYETEASNWNPTENKRPLTKHQKLTLHRSNSAFSFDDPLNLHVNMLVTPTRRSPAEREFLAKSLKHTTTRHAQKAGFPDASAAECINGVMMEVLHRKFAAARSLDPNETDSDDDDDSSQVFKKPKDEPFGVDDTESDSSYYESDEFEGDPPLPLHSSQSIELDEFTEKGNVDPSLVEARRVSSARKKTVIEHKSRTRNFAAPTVNHFDRIRVKLVIFVSHQYFEWFMTGCIILNTILLASEHYDQPDWLDTLISYGSHVFTALFTLECVLKIAALREEYFRQNWNLFDLFVVLTSYADIVLELALPTLTSTGKNTNPIRVLRLLRIFKLAQSWVTMKILLNIIFSTFGALGNLVLVLTIVIYIFAVLGMQIVGKEYIPANFGAPDPQDEGYPRWNFRNFWYSFMMVFRVLCGEWIEPLWDCLLAHKRQGQQWRCFIIFLPILIIGNFIVLNLFLALLLNSFSAEELKAQRDKEKEASGKSDNLKRIVGMLLNKRVLNGKEKENAVSALALALGGKSVESEFTVKVNEDEETRPRVMFKKATQKVIMHNRKAIAEKAIAKMEENEWRREAGSTTYDEDKELAGLRQGPRRFARNASGHPRSQEPKKNSDAGRSGSAHTLKEGVSSLTLNEDKEEGYEDEKPENLPPCVPKFCMTDKFQCCKSWERAREFALKIVSASFFEWTILSLILASSITLCFEDVYLDEKPKLKLALFVLNCIFVSIFVLEMVLKWMALGLKQYFTTFWTLLDASIVIVSTISLAFDIAQSLSKDGIHSQMASKSQKLGALKAFRTLRALRPLRAISRWQGMKVVVNALLFAIPAIFQVLIVCLLFWLVFAIMGVNLFKGKFFKCVYDEDGGLVPKDVASNMNECELKNSPSDPISWINSAPNFDNVFQAYLSLFQIATFEGWIEIMTAASDITDVGLQPVRDSAYYSYIFFVTFIIFGAFFTLNLFIGVIIDNFNMLKKKYEGNLLEVLLTPSQRRYYTAMKKLGRKKPRKVILRPVNRFLALFYDMSMSRRFEISIFVVIFLNMIVLAFERHDQRKIYMDILSGFNAYFSAIYAFEAIIKILGLRHFYFTVAWNVFDFCLVIFSMVDLFLADAGASFPFPPTLLRVVRVFRIGRVLRLIKAAKGIRRLLFALIVSLPALFNIGALLALVTFIYSILGMALFKDAVKSGPLDDVFSFETFPKSSLLLFRLLTAAGWNEVLDSLMSVQVVKGKYRKPMCGAIGEPDCVNSTSSVIFMVTYVTFTFLIIINMYIAIILENFVEANRDEEVGVVEDDFESFYIHWSKYDPGATQFIGFDQLSEFLASLDPPLDIPIPNIVAIVAFNLPIARGNKIHCLDILHALVKHILGEVESSAEFRKVQDQMEKKFRKQFPTRKLLDVISSTRIWKLQHNAAIVIQRAWRSYLRRKHRGIFKEHPSGASRRAESVIHKVSNFFRHAVGGDQKRRISGPAKARYPKSFFQGVVQKASLTGRAVRNQRHAAKVAATKVSKV